MKWTGGQLVNASSQAVALAMLGVAVAFSAGCAGGAWLESPLDAESPLEVPKHGYPTAIRASLSDLDSPASLPYVPSPVTAPAVAVAPAAETPAPADNAASQRAARQQPQLTPLAVIPSQYVHAQVPTASANIPASVAPSVATEPHAISSNLASQWPLAPIASADLAAISHTSAASWPLPAPAGASSSSVISPTATAAHAATGHIETASGTVQLEHAQSALIESLQNEIRTRREANSKDDELPRLEQQLRLVYLAAGRFDDAVAAVESLDASQREAYKNLMFGLGVWLSPDEARRSALRGAKVLHSLRDASSELASGSKLELRNLVFCERVDHFGWYSEFPKNEFQPKQQVILYAEVENFAAEKKGPAGFETELNGSYEILDSSGQIVASRKLQPDKEICRNYRRDYFLAYRIYMPDGISPGRYRLELTVEDLKAGSKYQGRKLGDGTIEFTVR
jgi:hypothetical protein